MIHILISSNFKVENTSDIKDYTYFILGNRLLDIWDGIFLRKFILTRSQLTFFPIGWNWDGKIPNLRKPEIFCLLVFNMFHIFMISEYIIYTYYIYP